MFHAVNTIRQATVALTLAVSLAVLTAPQALAGSGSSTYRDGWYGYAVALTKANQHPSTIDGRSPDTVDAALAARQRDFGPPDGWYGYAVSITKQAKLDGRSPVQRILAQEKAKAAALLATSQPQATVDGRSPDTVDAALAARQRDFGQPDGWYGYAVSITKQANLDGRSPVQRIIARPASSRARSQRPERLPPPAGATGDTRGSDQEPLCPRGSRKRVSRAAGRSCATRAR